MDKSAATLIPLPLRVLPGAEGTYTSHILKICMLHQQRSLSFYQDYILEKHTQKRTDTPLPSGKSLSDNGVSGGQEGGGTQQEIMQ